jgi:hypothetical protein
VVGHIIAPVASKGIGDARIKRLTDLEEREAVEQTLAEISLSTGKPLSSLTEADVSAYVDQLPLTDAEKRIACVVIDDARTDFAEDEGTWVGIDLLATLKEALHRREQPPTADRIDPASQQGPTERPMSTAHRRSPHDLLARETPRRRPKWNRVLRGLAIAGWWVFWLWGLRAIVMPTRGRPSSVSILFWLGVGLWASYEMRSDRR